jgi:hypothetical protein
MRNLEMEENAIEHLTSFDPVSDSECRLIALLRNTLIKIPHRSAEFKVVEYERSEFHCMQCRSRVALTSFALPR